MIASKFGIGQQVRHSLLGYLGVVVDIDPEYSLDEPSPDELAVNDELRADGVEIIHIGFFIRLIKLIHFGMPRRFIYVSPHVGKT